MKITRLNAKDQGEVVTMITNFLDQLVGTKVSRIPMKDICMSLLLKINGDFDDDLLQDTIELLLDF
jgi:hypothetical protein